jgi:hypothetical protein
VTPDKRNSPNEIAVYLNNELLVRGQDYCWSPRSLVLWRPRPQPPVRSFWCKFKLLVSLDWHELLRVPVPCPDLVVIESLLRRDTYLFGTPAFDEHVCYEEDL